ncbi:MAG: DNA repair protein RecO [bacterium]
MRLLSSEAIVLRGFDYSESDRIVVFYTREFGKIRGIAKGVKKIKSQAGGALLNLTHCYLSFYHHSALVSINQCEGIDFHPSFYRKVGRYLCGVYLGELVYLGTEEREPNPRLFELLRFFLKVLDDGHPDSETVLRVFEIRLLKLLGLFPELSVCVLCRGELTMGSGYKRKIPVSVSAGGLLCGRCSRRRTYHALSAGSIGFCKQALKLEPEKLTRLRLDSWLKGELKPFLNQYMKYSLEREIRSFSFLDYC